MRNSPPIQSAARQPRARVKVNGTIAPGLFEAEVDNNNLYQADSFRVELALSAQTPDMNWAWWASQTVLEVEVFMGFPADPNQYSETDLTSYILGLTDSIEIDPLADRIVLTGRDYTSVFLDSKISAAPFLNQTSSSIAVKLAQNHGLAATVTATNTLVGKFYAYVQAKLDRAHTEWDQLTFLAQQEGFQVFVSGKTLFFQAAATDRTDPYVIQWSVDDAGPPASNAKRLRFSRSLTLANDIKVFVKSVNFMQGTVIGASGRTHAVKTALSRPTLTGDAQIYVFNYPNLTLDQANQKARALALQLSQHELRIEATLPGDQLLDAHGIVQLTGTGTIYDTFYFIEHVIRRIGMTEGYTMELRAKNHPADSQVLV